MCSYYRTFVTIMQLETEMCGYSTGNQLTHEPPGKVVHLGHRDYTTCQYKYPPGLVALASMYVTQS
jgi:hypothetical protein